MGAAKILALHTPEEAQALPGPSTSGMAVPVRGARGCAEPQKNVRHRLACCAPQSFYAAACESPGCSRELQPWGWRKVEAAFILPTPPLPPQFGCGAVLMRVGQVGD